jgi:hypothetical protein
MSTPNTRRTKTATPNAKVGTRGNAGSKPRTKTLNKPVDESQPVSVLGKLCKVLEKKTDEEAAEILIQTIKHRFKGRKSQRYCWLCMMFRNELVNIGPVLDAHRKELDKITKVTF